MSKIEDGIRKASRQHAAARKRPIIEGDDGHAQHYSTLDTQERRALVLYKFQAGREHNPSKKTLEDNRIIHEGYSEQALGKYKMLRTRISQHFHTEQFKTLAITSANDGAGKSVTAINLAIALASQGQNQIYLVDLDLRNPSIANYFGLPEDIAGFGAYLRGEVQLTDILWDVDIENLVVLANRDRMENSSECLTSEPMRKLIASFIAATPKPIVIFDLPPVLTADDAVAMSPFVDCYLVIVSEGETSRDDLGHALDVLRGTNILGVVLNKAGGR